uniref:CBFD_NFYB_HMF domain-containing protein n=1 Tax=Meloidogyne hapla TaxID=6305 RepID=A0A1I8AX02_MELHA
MAKPVSNRIMTYGRKHPFFRNKILIPVGRGITNITTRLRMRDLGLGRPQSLVQLSDEAALEQASDILQEAVLYIYGIAIFSLYYYISKANEKHSVSHDDLKEIIEKIEERFEIIQKEIDCLKKNEKDVGGWFSWQRKTSLPVQKQLENISTEKLTISRSEAMKRLADYDKIGGSE